MKLKIILASVRKGRLGEQVAGWVCNTLDTAKVEYELLDLEDYSLPFVDTSKQPFDLEKNIHIKSYKIGLKKSMKVAVI